MNFADFLTYDPDTGVLRWKPRARNLFRAERDWKVWNVRYAGAEAGCVASNGYVHVTVNGRTYRAHRVAWELHYGHPPTQVIDHINGEKADNRVCNLRDVSVSMNGRNRKIGANNTSGVIGVRLWDDQKWHATIMVDGASQYLGGYGCVTAAAIARKMAEVRHGFGPMHGAAA